MTFDVKLIRRIRKEFPAAEVDPSGRKRAFLDNGAGTLVTRRSSEAEARARVDWSANVGNYFPESKGASDVILEGRKAVADLLRADGPETIVSGESCTSLLFSLSYALSRDFKGDENIVLTGYEHFANINPWAELGGMDLIKEVRFANFHLESGLLDMEHMKSLIDKNTKVVAVTAASNVLGTRSDLVEIGKMAKEAGALFVVDGVHHVAHGPTDVKKLGCDAYVFSGYKLFSRHGSYMYMKPEHIENLNPYKVDPSPKHGPEKWELGTRDQAMFAAIKGAIDYLVWLGDPSSKDVAKPGPQRSGKLKQTMEKIEAYEKDLSRIVLDGYGKILGLRYVPGLTLYGPRDVNVKMGRDPTFAFKLEGLDDHEVSKALWDDYALAVGAEDYYSRVPAQYKTKTMLRATFVHYNTREEVLAFLKALNEIATKKKK
ncbi:MAG: aminotransferase class V-fold PLP-dependent enzyme [Thermoplasmata archaeon]|jgi:selenocysteine lyase/cysteine desulfurase|nr:aminotransferase class V-fold PLP-dependent enzyme [Thermoplasmata archaeon]